MLPFLLPIKQFNLVIQSGIESYKKSAETEGVTPHLNYAENQYFKEA
jgi:hypothetical protein